MPPPAATLPAAPAVFEELVTQQQFHQLLKAVQQLSAGKSEVAFLQQHVQHLQQ